MSSPGTLSAWDGSVLSYDPVGGPGRDYRASLGQEGEMASVCGSCLFTLGVGSPVEVCDDDLAHKLIC